jgi:hypothetical protein
MVRQTVDGHDLHSGQGARETLQERPAGFPAGPLRPHHQGNPLGVASFLDQPGEAFPNNGGLARPRPARDEERATSLVEDLGLFRIGLEWHCRTHQTAC